MDEMRKLMETVAPLFEGGDYYRFAKKAVDRFLGTPIDASSMYSEVYALAYEGAIDAGAPPETADSIARELGNDYADDMEEGVQEGAGPYTSGAEAVEQMMNIKDQLEYYRHQIENLSIEMQETGDMLNGAIDGLEQASNVLQDAIDTESARSGIDPYE
jgi:hypothetical protein